MSNRGYMLMARQLLKHPRFKPRGAFTQFEAWYWLIESAAYVARDVPIMMGNRREIITLQPGQLSHSIRFLACAWHWSPNRVRRFIDDLSMDGSVDTHTDTAQTLITLCNWGKYQRPFDEADTATDTPADTATDTKKKEIKEKKEYAPSKEPKCFDDWYASYPKKKQREAARRAYAKVIGGNLISESDLLAKTKAFSASWSDKPRDQRRFIPYPASWLNAGGYDDEPDGADPVPAVRDPRTFTDQDWQKRLRYFQETDVWMEAWGAEPGHPGCLVPAHLILNPVSTSSGAA
jgi:hypothetical protein